jgi:hypothetical protein
MSPDDAVVAAEKHILEVIAEPWCSYWLRNAARAAMTRDPVDVLDDAEILLMMLQRWVWAVRDAAKAAAEEPVLPFGDAPVAP